MTHPSVGVAIGLVAGVGLVGCSKSDPPAKATLGSGSAAVAATGDAAIVVALDAAAPAALPACSDGGTLAGAAAGAAEVRFCLTEDKTDACWTVPLARGSAAAPLAPSGALDGIQRLSFDQVPADATWTVTAKHPQVNVCGPDGCKELAVVPGKNPDDDKAAVSGDAAVSASGTHVAVVRGFEGIAAQTVDIYDRASGKRVGVLKPKTMCVDLQGFANETLVAVEWDCANQGGDRLLVAPSGKVVARIARLSTAGDPFMQLDGERWVFAEDATASIEIYDVASGNRLGGRELEQFATVAVANGRAFAFEPHKARVYVYDSAGKEIAATRVPPCRYEWETEMLGPMHLMMDANDLVKAIGAPTKKTKPDLMVMGRTLWTFATGLVAEVHPNYVNDATGQPVPPWFVVGVIVTAPSKLQLRGVGIGSTLDELKRAFGTREVASETSPTRFVAGNAGDEGIVFTLVDGKVTKIVMGDIREPD